MTKKVGSLVQSVIFLLILSSCGGVKKMAVGTTAGFLYEASPQLEKESSFENFQESILPNLKFAESLWSLHPENEELLVSLIKGYAGYGFGVHETLAMKEIILETEKKPHVTRAKEIYSKAIGFGFRFFEGKGLDREQMLKAAKENKLRDLLERRLYGDEVIHLEAAMFLGQALGGLINLSKDNMVLVTQLPLVKGLFDWSCGHDPDLNFGSCAIFDAAYDAGRPRMLGGHPERGKEKFLAAMKKYPNNWLIHVSYLQFSIIPFLDEDGWESLKASFIEFQKKHQDEKIWGPHKKRAPEFVEQRLRLYQAIAIKRFNQILEIEGEVF